jgi:hypothetical protein
MKNGIWRAVYLGLVLLLLVALAGKWLWPGQKEREESIRDDLRAYLPALVGTTFQFEGSGMEFASFSRRITFAAPGLVQLEDLSGTNLAVVLEHRWDRLRLIYSEEEFYAEESLLDEEQRRGRPGRSVDLVLLKAPLKVGTAWRDQNFQREIVALDQVVEVPLGVFYDVVVVKSISHDAPENVLYEYYAKNVGLIKREFLLLADGEPYLVTSSLKSISCPLSQ